MSLPTSDRRPSDPKDVPYEGPRLSSGQGPTLSFDTTDTYAPREGTAITEQPHYPYPSAAGAAPSTQNPAPTQPGPRRGSYQVDISEPINKLGPANPGCAQNPCACCCMKLDTGILCVAWCGIIISIAYAIACVVKLQYSKGFGDEDIRHYTDLFSGIVIGCCIFCFITDVMLACNATKTNNPLDSCAFNSWMVASVLWLIATLIQLGLASKSLALILGKAAESKRDRSGEPHFNIVDDKRPEIENMDNSTTVLVVMVSLGWVFWLLRIWFIFVVVAYKSSKADKHVVHNRLGPTSPGTMATPSNVQMGQGGYQQYPAAVPWGGNEMNNLVVANPVVVASPIHTYGGGLGYGYGGYGYGGGLGYGYGGGLGYGYGVGSYYGSPYSVGYGPSYPYGGVYGYGSPYAFGGTPFGLY